MTVPAPPLHASSLNGDDEDGELPTPVELMRLARRYGTIAERVYHFEGQLDAVHGIALAAHGVASRVESRIEDIAAAVKAKRGAPIPPAFMSNPPPPPGSDSFEMRFNPTDTGTHVIMTDREVQKLKDYVSEQQAQQRGARIYAQELKDKSEDSDRRSKRFQRNVLFVLGVAGPILVFVGYCLEHFHWVK
jgi:hypothetical protein